MKPTLDETYRKWLAKQPPWQPLRLPAGVRYCDYDDCRILLPMDGERDYCRDHEPKQPWVSA